MNRREWDFAESAGNQRDLDLEMNGEHARSDGLDVANIGCGAAVAPGCSGSPSIAVIRSSASPVRRPHPYSSIKWAVQRLPCPFPLVTVDRGCVPSSRPSSFHRAACQGRWLHPS
jgi:hypothetical protein